MSARALVSGALHKAAEERTSKAGNPFATFTLREKVNGSTRWWSVVAFDEASIAAVLSMKVGEPIAVSGEFSAELWTPEGGGEPRRSVALPDVSRRASSRSASAGIPLPNRGRAMTARAALFNGIAADALQAPAANYPARSLRGRFSNSTEESIK